MTGTANATVTGLSRVTVVAPHSRVDLALPADVPVAALLPRLLELTGELRPDGGAGHGGWALTRSGIGPLNLGRSLTALGVEDGEVLHLQPRAVFAPPPVFDDVVDAIAASVHPRYGRWTPALTRRAGDLVLIAATTVAATVLVILGPAIAPAVVAGSGVVALLTLGVSVRFGHHVEAGGLGVAAVPLGFAAGFAAVPGGPGRPNLLLAAAIAATTAVLALAALGTAIAALTAAAVALALLTAAELAAVLVAHPAPGIAAATLCGALAAVVVVPRWAGRLARLPLPVIPSDPDAVAEASVAENDFAELQARARLAQDYLIGATIGCLAVAAGSVVVLASAATPAALLTAGLAQTALALSARRADDVYTRSAWLAAAVGPAVVTVPVLALDVGPSGAWWLAGAALAVGLMALAIGLTSGPRSSTPTARRLVDLVEALAVCALVPVAAQVIQLYRTVRHL